MKRLFLTPVLTGLLAAPVVAQEVTYLGFSGSYGSFDGGPGPGGDATTNELSADLEYNLDQFYFGLALDQAGLASGPLEIDFRGYVLSFGYMPTAEILAGVSLMGSEFSGFMSSEESVNGFDAFAQYVTTNFGVGASYRQPDSEDSEFSFTHVYGYFDVSPEVQVGGAVEMYGFDDYSPAYFLNGQYESGPIFVRGYGLFAPRFDEYYTGVRATYEVMPALALGAHFETAFGDGLPDDYQALGASASYAISDAISIDGNLNRISIDGGEIDSYSLTLTYQTGSQKRLDRITERNVNDDFSAGILGLQPNLSIGGFVAGF